jgi:hypothetical protein
MSLEKFGELNGQSIDNIDTIMSQIALSLDTDPKVAPDIEYIVTYPIGYITLPFGLGAISHNTYGHSVLMYRQPNGQHIVVNIEAKETGKPFIRFYEPKNYIFGTNEKTCGAQRGIYNRNIVGIRIYGVKDEDILEMHNYIHNLIEEEHKSIKFNIVLGPILNKIKEVFPSMPEYGNCSKWTSAMLQKAKVIDGTYVWPRTLFINIFELSAKKGLKTDVVFYEQPTHVQNLSVGVKAKPIWFESIAPFQLSRNWFYSDVKQFAKAIVTIPANTTTAIVKINENHLKPSSVRNIVNNKYFITCNVVLSMCITYKMAKYTKYTLKKLYNMYR